MPSIPGLPVAFPVDPVNDLLAISQLNPDSSGPTRVTGRVSPKNILAYPRVRFRNDYAYRLYGGGPTFQTSGANQTDFTVFQLDAWPEYVRFVYGNSVNATWSVDNAAFAISSGVNDGYVPLDINGNPAPGAFTSVTFNNNGANIDPLLQAGGSTLNLTVPATSGNQIVAYSDWMVATPFARTDGKQGCYLFARTFSTGTQQRTPQGSPLSPDLDRLGPGGFASGVNSAVSPFTQAATPSSATIQQPFAVEYISASAGVTFACFGSSVSQGTGSTGNASGWLQRVQARLNSKSLPISIYNFGLGGGTQTQIDPQAVRDIPVIKPQIVTVQPFNNNSSGGSQAAMDADFASAMAVARVAQQNGAIVILLTADPNPSQSANPAFEALRLQSVARVLASENSVTYVIDMNAILGTGSNPVQYKPGFDSGDGQHPSDAGYIAVADVMTPMVSQILGMTP